MKDRISQSIKIWFFILRAGKLTWHNGLIPENEIWVKVGGDKGGHSFKQMFQIANVDSPNALKNTVVICAFEAGDSIRNLECGLHRHQSDVAELMQATWR